jgi:hypothetical protein
MYGGGKMARMCLIGPHVYLSDRRDDFPDPDLDGGGSGGPLSLLLGGGGSVADEDLYGLGGFGGFDRLSCASIRTELGVGMGLTTGIESRRSM